MTEIEISLLDLKHQHLRLRNARKERALLLSLQEEGFYEGLGCICADGSEPILLDGFKRYRCALKLRMRTVPVVNLGGSEIAGILQILRNHDARALTIVEQAALVDELYRAHGLSASEIARKLDRSPAWVSLRHNLFAGMSAPVSQAIFSGNFPLRSYLYTLRPFTRVKGVKGKDIDEFVALTSGREISTRDVQTLANAYFSGNEEIRTQMREGNLDWTLRQLRQVETPGAQAPPLLSQFEQGVFINLQLIQRVMGRLAMTCGDKRLVAHDFFSRAAPIAKEIKRQLPYFTAALERLYDR